MKCAVGMNSEKPGEWYLAIISRMNCNLSGVKGDKVWERVPGRGKNINASKNAVYSGHLGVSVG